MHQIDIEMAKKKKFDASDFFFTVFESDDFKASDTIPVNFQKKNKNILQKIFTKDEKDDVGELIGSDGGSQHNNNLTRSFTQ